MISFKQYLIESRSAPLYHGTGRISAENIITTGMNTNPRSAGRTRGMSGFFVTRNIKHAKSFGRVIFVLDQEKLRSKFKIIPTKNWDDRSSRGYPKPYHMTFDMGDDEFEEFVIVKQNPFKDFRKYIKEVIFDHVTPGDNIIKELERYNISYRRIN